MIKLFASDLDGTLLNALHEVDPIILGTIREVTASGAHFAVATGRTFRSAGDFGFDAVENEVVCANGALILDRAGEVIRHKPIDPEVLGQMLRAFPQMSFECVGVHQSYITGTYEQHQACFKSDGLVQRIAMAGMRRRRKKMNAHAAYAQTPDQVLAHEICKVNARTTDTGLERELHAFLAEHTDAVVNTPFNPVMFEICDACVNKGEALLWLAEHLGIAPDEVAVYGDGGNDLVMLERFVHAYAPANGTEAAKAAAGHVIGSNLAYAVPRHMRATVRAQRPQAAGYTVIE